MTRREAVLRALRQTVRRPETVPLSRDIPERLCNLPNLVTAVRGAFCCALLSYAAVAHSVDLLYIALGAQWFLDFFDGFLARVLGQETKFGACFDSHTDRLIACLFLLTMWQIAPSSRIAICCYLVYLVLVDAAMFTQAMQTGILSTNYYYVIDLTAWKICWSPIGKFITAALIPALILIPQTQPMAAIVVCLAIAARVPVLKRVLINIQESASPHVTSQPASAVVAHQSEGIMSGSS